jgi:hypothetical protein
MWLGLQVRGLAFAWSRRREEAGSPPLKPGVSRLGRKAMKRLMPIAGLFLLFVLGCSTGLSGPSVEQVKQDLVGKEVRIITSSVFGLPDMTWMTIAQVQDLVIQQRFTDKAAKTDELHALVTVTFVTLTRREESSPRRGGLVIGYKQFDQGWKLQSVKVTGEFSDAQSTKKP